MPIPELMQELHDRKFTRGGEAPSAHEVNEILRAVGLPELAVDYSIDDQGSQGSNLFDATFYMVLFLAQRIMKLEGKIKQFENGSK